MSHLTVPKRAHRVTDITTPDGMIWTVYELAPRGNASPLWPAFKVMVPPDTPAKWKHRRAFSVYWAPLGLRLRRDTEARLLKMQMPDLYERLELLLALEYGPEWLVRVQGMTTAEINLEVGRLNAFAAKRRARKRGEQAL